MNSLLAKEQILYEAVKNNSHSTSSFITAFAEYFNFLVTDGVSLIEHLAPKISARKELSNDIDRERVEVIADVSIALTQLINIADEHDLQDNLRIKEGISCLNTLVTGSYASTFGNPLGSRDLDLRDAVKALYELDLIKEANSFLNHISESSNDISTKHLIAFEKQEAYTTRFKHFFEQDKLTIEGALIRLVSLFHKLHIFADGTKLIADDFIEMINDKAEQEVYREQLQAAVLNASNVYPHEGVSQDIERIHQSIELKNIESKSSTTTQLFEVKDGNIYHFEIGKLSYNLDGIKDPKFIRLFKNIIDYMPSGKDRIRISEFEQLLPSHEQVGRTYRESLGKSAKSFGNFFQKNGVKNVHPNTKEPVIHVTDEYITFRNNL